MNILKTELSFTSEQSTQFLKLIEEDNVEFFFVASSNLKDTVAQGSHPRVRDFPQFIVTGILLGNTITISKNVIREFLNETLNEPWKFMLANGEIRVRGEIGNRKDVGDSIWKKEN